MRFQSTQRWFPRDPLAPSAYEDASAVSRKLGRAVIADGVSSAMLSRSWARLVTRTAVISPPAYDDESLTAWVAALQDSWWKGVDSSKLGWAGQEKLRRFGAQATLLIVDVQPKKNAGATDEACDTLQEYHLRAHAIGDCCLFLVRDGVKVLTFPMTRALDFEASPFALSSKAKGIKYAEQFRHLDNLCRVGDMLVLCTDAIAAWAMREYEAERLVDWRRYRDDEKAWQDDVVASRRIGPSDAGNQLVIDDCTLLVLDITPEAVIQNVNLVELDASDDPFVHHNAILEVAGMDSATQSSSNATDSSFKECEASKPPHLPVNVADNPVCSTANISTTVTTDETITPVDTRDDVSLDSAQASQPDSVTPTSDYRHQASAWLRRLLSD